ncbi:hypothetical protein [Sphingomonas sp. BK580]|uniref:hypothetical protein n=1 Tax=Sphingomonas sp. BK580 TaxID=2586972 RepID=UPI001613E330|nr:hypothetical protein [Sphingomonas sp. BK580]MBB3691855.1 hypothetical protein [Sphingomonas sp. BK580]
MGGSDPGARRADRRPADRPDRGHALEQHRIEPVGLLGIPDLRRRQPSIGGHHAASRR